MRSLRPQGCMTCGGKMQIGGSVDLSKYYNNLPTDSPEAPASSPRKPLNSVEDMINKGILDTPKGYDSAEQWYSSMSGHSRQRSPINLQNFGIALQEGSAGLSWLSGIMERNRQNQYMNTQLSTLGQRNPMPADDFQPNPYSLYAKYGGNIKAYLKAGGWIQGAIKHPGRCTPGSPNYDCPKGSPQYNLAQTFKKHHGFHKKK